MLIQSFLIAQEQLSEETLKKQGLELFEQQKFKEAQSHYSKLYSNYNTNMHYCYMLGASILYGQENKEDALIYLERALNNGNTEPDLYYYLAKAYHINYRFSNAITYYKKYQSTGKKRKQLPVSREIEMCENGKTLLSNITDIAVKEKKSIALEDFHKSYTHGGFIGKVLKVPPLFLSKIDKKKKFNSVMYTNPSFQRIFFASYGESENSGTDIYYVEKNKKDEFSAPVKLPSTINTIYDEDYAFYNTANNTLYFASKGHNSMGGYDIFKSTYNEADNSWSTPQNIDFAINSAGDDFLMITNEDESEAIFASTRTSEASKVHVYTVALTRAAVDAVVLKGTYNSDFDKNVVIRVKNPSTGEEIGNFKPDQQTGEYSIVLPNGGAFDYYLESEKAESLHKGTINVPYQEDLVSLSQDLDFNLVGEEETFAINNKFDEKASINDENIKATLLKQKQHLEVNYDQVIERAQNSKPIHTEREKELTHNHSMLLEKAQALLYKRDSIAELIGQKNKALSASNNLEIKEVSNKLELQKNTIEQTNSKIEAYIAAIQANSEDLELVDSLNQLNEHLENDASDLKFNSLYKDDINEINTDIEALEKQLSQLNSEEKTTIQQKINEKRTEKSNLIEKQNMIGEFIKSETSEVTAIESAFNAIENDQALTVSNTPEKETQQQPNENYFSDYSSKETTISQEEKPTFYEEWNDKIKQDLQTKQIAFEQTENGSFEQEQLAIQIKDLEQQLALNNQYLEELNTPDQQIIEDDQSKENNQLNLLSKENQADQLVLNELDEEIEIFTLKADVETNKSTKEQLRLTIDSLKEKRAIKTGSIQAREEISEHINQLNVQNTQDYDQLFQSDVLNEKLMALNQEISLLKEEKQVIDETLLSTSKKDKPTFKNKSSELKHAIVLAQSKKEVIDSLKSIIDTLEQTKLSALLTDNQNNTLEFNDSEIDSLNAYSLFEPLSANQQKINSNTKKIKQLKEAKVSYSQSQIDSVDQIIESLEQESTQLGKKSAALLSQSNSSEASKVLSYIKSEQFNELSEDDVQEPITAPLTQENPIDSTTLASIVVNEEIEDTSQQEQTNNDPTKTEASFAENKEEEKTPSSSKKLSVGFKILDRSQLQNAGKITINPEIPEGIIYKVQVGAFRNPIPEDMFKEFSPISGQTTSSGLTRYQAGIFLRFKNASTAKDQIRSMGYSDAFVVAYQNGKRISISKARANSDQQIANQNQRVETKPTQETASSVQEPISNQKLQSNQEISSLIEDVKKIEQAFLTVQVGAFRGKSNDKKLNSISPLYAEFKSDGWIKYNTGVFFSLDQAIQRKKQIIKEYGIEDAFVTAYLDGQRIRVTEALDLISESPLAPQEDYTSTTNSDVQPNSSAPENDSNDESTQSLLGTTFSILLFENKTALEVEDFDLLNQLNSQGYEITAEKNENGSYTYSLGNFTQRSNAENKLNEIQTKYSIQAKIITLNNGFTINE